MNGAKLITNSDGDQLTGLYRPTDPLKLQRGKWYALVVERGLSRSGYTFSNDAIPCKSDSGSTGGKVDNQAHFMQVLPEGYQPNTLTIDTGIYFSIIPIKNHKKITEITESQEVIQIFKVSDVKEVEKFYKDVVVKSKIKQFGGIKIRGKKKIIKAKKRKKK